MSQQKELLYKSNCNFKTLTLRFSLRENQIKKYAFFLINTASTDSPRLNTENPFKIN